MLPLTNALRRWIADRSGNVALIFGLSLVPTLFLGGMAMDYATAIQRQQSLNAAADSAVLAAVSPTMLTQTTAQAQTTANNVFNGLASSIGNASISSSHATVTQNGLTRTATFTYSANSNNFFPVLLGQTSWRISGNATASTTAAPNIDFYMLLDNSPSMALAATSAGISTMIANTPQQDGGQGCAFACHQSQPNSGDTPGNQTGWDNYKLAQSLGVVSRIQNVAAATNSLTSTAAQLAQSLGTIFRMAVYDFNTNNTGSNLNTVKALTIDLASAGTAAAGIDVLEVCKGNYLTCTNYDDSTDTDFSDAMTALNTLMPSPGDGSASGSPQQVVFIVTDGVEDKKATSCAYPMIGLSGFNRCIQPFDITTCSTVKNRGIKIAILYTQYFPMPNESFYLQYVAPFASNIGPNLQSCASPGLYFSISTSDDITNAMTMLFNTVVQNVEAHLSQ